MKHSLAALALAAASAVAISPASAQSFSYADFHDVSQLTLNGSAHQNSSGNKLTLTNATDGQSGSAWSTQKIHLGSKASFSSVFSFEILDHGGIPGWGIDGADGLTFTLQNNDNSVGGSGGGIGYGGIDKSVTVEFDTFQNGWDPDTNHVGINMNGDLTSLATFEEGIPFDNAATWWAWIDYDGETGNLAVRWAQNSMRPNAATLTQKLNIAQILGGDGLPVEEAYVGFTSGTGAGWGQHNILSWNFEDSYDPNGAPLPTTTPEPASLVLLATGLAGVVAGRRKVRGKLR